LWTQLFVGLFSTSLLWLFLRDPLHDVKKVKEKPEPARDDEDKTQDS